MKSFLLNGRKCYTTGVLGLSDIRALSKLNDVEVIVYEKTSAGITSKRLGNTDIVTLSNPTCLYVKGAA
jgi:hypothetical protein